MPRLDKGQCGWRIVFGLLGFVLGIVASGTRDWFILEITLGRTLHILSLFAILFLAHGYFMKSHASRKRRLDLFILMCSDVLDSVRRVHDEFVKLEIGVEIEEMKMKLIFMRLRSYSNALMTIKRSLDEHNDLMYHTSPSVQTLMDDLQCYRTVVASESYPRKVSDEQSKNEEKMYYRILSNVRLFQLNLAEAK